MLTYNTLKDKAKEFLAVTGLKIEEFARLLPAFESGYRTLYPADKTAEGKTRRRQPGGGAKGVLQTFEDKLLFILVYQKTYPLQTLHGLQFGLSQSQTNYWIHRLLRVLQRALGDLKMTPERDGQKVAHSPLVNEGTPDLLIDGTERGRRRPNDATRQKAHYSGKKRAHTDKNLVLVHEQTGKVVYLSPTVEGKKHDKKAADEAAIHFPKNATLSKDTGFQGYEPAGVITRQPKKSPKVKPSARATKCSIASSPVRA